MDKTRLRIRFTKTGNLRWISHKDLARLWERLLRRADLQLVFSEGFHPKPKINFPSALALGIEALEEVVELEVHGKVDIDQVKQKIVCQMPEGMSLIELQAPDLAEGKAKVVAASYQISIPPTRVEQTRARIGEIQSAGRMAIERDGKTIVCSTEDDFELALEGEQLKFTIPVTSDGSVRPAEVLEHLGLSGLLEDGAVLQRSKVHLKQEESAEQPKSEQTV